MKIDWRKVLGTVAPVLATAAGGPLAGVVAKTIASKLLGKPEATQEEVESAIVSANPETLIKLKEIEMEFERDMQKVGIDFERIASEDRASARAREVAVRDRTPAVLAFAVTAGFFGALGWMLAYGKPVTGGDALLVMLGSLGTAFAGIVSYYFGSSAGSKLKTEAMSRPK